MAGAGLFDSILNVPLSDMANVRKAIVNVWLSLFTERAIISRKQYGITSEQAHMSVLIQQQIHSDFSFVIHTKNPVNQNTNEVYIEVAAGLGETLASANQSGTPYRLIYRRDADECEVMAFANYSYGLFAAINGTEPENQIIDYSKIQFSTEVEQLELLGKRLGRVSLEIERELGGSPQDIEGALVID